MCISMHTRTHMKTRTAGGLQHSELSRFYMRRGRGGKAGGGRRHKASMEERAAEAQQQVRQEFIQAANKELQDAQQQRRHLQQQPLEHQPLLPPQQQHAGVVALLSRQSPAGAALSMEDRAAEAQQHAGVVGVVSRQTAASAALAQAQGRDTPQLPLQDSGTGALAGKQAPLQAPPLHAMTGGLASLADLPPLLLRPTPTAGPRAPERMRKVSPMRPPRAVPLPQQPHAAGPRAAGSVKLPPVRTSAKRTQPEQGQMQAQPQPQPWQQQQGGADKSSGEELIQAAASKELEAGRGD